MVPIEVIVVVVIIIGIIIIGAYKKGTIEGQEFKSSNNLQPID